MKYIFLLLTSVFICIPFLIQGQLIGYSEEAYDKNAPKDGDERIHLHVDIKALSTGCDEPKMFTLEK